MKTYEITYNNGNAQLTIAAHYVKESADGWTVCGNPDCGIAELHFFRKGKAIQNIKEV